MARSQIEVHPKRAEIEKAIRAGVSSRSIAAQFGIRSFSSVAAYARKLRARDAERKAEQSGKGDVDRLVERLDMIWSLLTNHIRAHDPAENPKLDRQTLDVLKEMRATVREVANVKGLLKGPGINIGIGVNVNATTNVQSAERDGVPADEIKTALFRALRGHPEARDSVVHEFQRVQQRHDGVVIDAEVVEDTPPPRVRSR